jgi:hypothetical protein
MYFCPVEGSLILVLSRPLRSGGSGSRKGRWSAVSIQTDVQGSIPYGDASR